jgi:hypothetical protein
MKKISLKDVQNGLKRDEMRVIMGGCGTGGSCQGADSRCAGRGGCTVRAADGNLYCSTCCIC